MPELTVDLITLLSDRAAPGITVGIAVSTILWSLRLAHSRAALIAALLLSTTFLAADWGLALLVALQLILAGIGGRLSAAGTPPGNLDILGLTSITSLCAVGSMSGLGLAYWYAAGCGAAVGAGITWTAETFGTAFEDTPRMFSKTRIGGEALVATSLAGGSLVTAALWVGVLGTGEPALAAVGSLFGLTLARQVGGTRPLRLATAGCVAGASTALLVAVLP